MNIKSRQWEELLISLFLAFDLTIKHDQSLQLASYVVELTDTNKKVNLTTITAPEEVAEKHITDSVIPAKLIPANSSVLDLGTGGGFPGIPLKICVPSLKLTLVDSSRKKINFLKYVIRLLNLQNISAHQYRVEELSSHPEFAQQFDVVISRAFTSLKKFLELSAPLIKPNGKIIAMKGRAVEKEIGELRSVETFTSIYQVNDHNLELAVEKYRLPASGDERSLVIARNFTEK